MQTVEEFIKYYKGAGKAELKDRLHTLGKKYRDRASKNERKAINTLLM